MEKLCKNVVVYLTGTGLGFNHVHKYVNHSVLTDHFNKGVWKSAPYSVHILENIECSGKTKRGAINALEAFFSNCRKPFWMLQLITVFPYDLNNDIGNEPKREYTHVLAGKMIPPLVRNNPRVTK